MVRHIVAWSFKDGFSEQENIENAKRVKQELEALVGKIPGLLELKVYICSLPTSCSDLMLESLLESEEALKEYQVHPDHVKVSTFVGTVVKDRKCLDFIIS